ncbi:MAG: ABC transporter permease [bacterium]|nr:ABC transporter permease [bacterium]
MKQYKEQLTGTGMVYRFTLLQFLKNKANILALVIMILFAAGSVPVTSLLNADDGTAQHSDISNVYFADCEEPYTLTYTDLQTAAASIDLWAETTFHSMNEALNGQQAAPAPRDAYASILFDAETGMYRLSVTAAEDTELSDGELSALSAFLTEQFDQMRYRTLNISAEQLSFVMASWESDTQSYDSYFEDEDRWSTQYLVQLIYSIVVMMVSVLSVSYIVRTVIEEKASKLIELLMVSVKPLALIAGKILAAMSYVLITIGGMALAYVLSRAVCGRFMTVAPLTDMFAGGGFTFSGGLTNISVVFVIAVVISLLLAFLTFAIIAGLSATGCSSTEDSESATLGVTLLIMAGYMLSVIATSSGSTALAYITSIIPVVSVFCAPVHYMMGNIGFGILVLSWVLQAIVVILLAVFCAKIYSSLLMHRGNRIRLKDMLSMAKTSSVKGEQ